MNLGWALAMGALLGAGCSSLRTPRVPLEVPPGLTASAEADTRACNRWSAGSGDEKVAFAGCMIARGYGARVDVRPAPLAPSAHVMVRRTTGASDAQAITDLLNVCRGQAEVAAAARPPIVGPVLSSVKGWLPGDRTVKRSEERLRECLAPAGLEVTTRRPEPPPPGG